MLNPWDATTGNLSMVEATAGVYGPTTYRLNSTGDGLVKNEETIIYNAYQLGCTHFPSPEKFDRTILSPLPSRQPGNGPGS